MAAKKKNEEGFLESTLRRLGEASVNVASAGTVPMLKAASQAVNRAKSVTPRASKEALDSTPKLQKDPNTNIRSTTTIQDAQGNSYFAPAGVEELPSVVQGSEPVTRKQVEEYMENRALDATPSRLTEIKARREAEKEAARMGEMQQANRRMADDSNKSMNAAAAERSASATESKPTKMVNPLDKVQESLKGPNTIFGQPNTKFASYDSLSDMAKAPVSESMKAPDRDFDALFKKATGTSFDPKSKRDRSAMAEIQSLLSSRADLADKSDTKVALAWYANKRKK